MGGASDATRRQSTPGQKSPTGVRVKIRGGGSYSAPGVFTPSDSVAGQGWYRRPGRLQADRHSRQEHKQRSQARNLRSAFARGCISELTPAVRARTWHGRPALGSRLIQHGQMPMPLCRRQLGDAPFARRRDGSSSHIEELGGIRGPNSITNAGGEYDGFREAFGRGPQRLWSVEIEVQRLINCCLNWQSVDSISTVQTLFIRPWRMPQAALEARERTRHRELRGEIRCRAFGEHQSANASEQERDPVNVDTLNVGDQFEVRGERFNVVGVDENTGAVTVKDGLKREIPAGTEVFPTGRGQESGNLRRVFAARSASAQGAGWLHCACWPPALPADSPDSRPESRKTRREQPRRSARSIASSGIGHGSDGAAGGYAGAAI